MSKICMKLARILFAVVFGYFLFSTLFNWFAPSATPQYQSSVPIGTKIDDVFRYDDYEPCTFMLFYDYEDETGHVSGGERYKLNGTEACEELEDDATYSIKGTVVGYGEYEDGGALEIKRRNPAMYYFQQYDGRKSIIPVVEVERLEKAEWVYWAFDNFSWAGSPHTVQLACSEEAENRDLEVSDVVVEPDFPKRTETFTFILHNDSTQAVTLLNYGSGEQLEFKILVFDLGTMQNGVHPYGWTYINSSGNLYKCDCGGITEAEGPYYCQCIVPQEVGFENLAVRIAIVHEEPFLYCEGEYAIGAQLS